MTRDDILLIAKRMIEERGGSRIDDEEELLRFAVVLGNRVAAALRAALAQEPEPEPAQEPVGWNWMLDGRPYGQAYYGNPPDADIAERAAIAGRTVRLLYTTPPQRPPLPKHDQHCVDVPGYGLMAVRLVRAVERAHGIGEPVVRGETE